jgi:hypothetical protein
MYAMIVNVLLKLVGFKKTFFQKGMNMRMYAKWLLLFMSMNTGLLLAHVDGTSEIDGLLSMEHLSLSRVRKKDRCKKLCNLWVRNCVRAGSLNVKCNALVVGDLTVDGEIITAYGGGGGSSCGLLLTSLNGQVLLGVTDGAPVFNYLTSPDGSVTFITGPGTLGFEAFPFFGNTAYVDQIYGNDSLAAVNKKPYKTITAALAAAGSYASPSKPVTVWVFPGIYSDTATSPETFPLIIPNNVTLLGLSAGPVVGVGGVTISSASSTNLIRMGNNTILENAMLQISGSSNVTGISLFATNNTANIKRVTLNVSTTAGNAIGIDGNIVSGTINAETMNITVSSPTYSRAVLVGSGSTVTTRMTNTRASGGTNAIAVETVGGTFTGNASAANGATSDIAQTSGTINVADVHLVNSTANGGNFTNLFLPSTITWATSDNPIISGTNVMTSATGPVLSTTPLRFGIVIPQQIVIRNLRVNAVNAAGGGLSTTFTVYQTRSGVTTATPLTTTLTDPATSASDTTHSVTCLPGDVLSIEIDNPEYSVLGIVTVSLDVY